MASLKNRFREGMVAPPGAISYGDCVVLDGGVYSLDKFRPRFRFNWGNLNPHRLGDPVPLSDTLVVDFVREKVLYSLGDSCIAGSPGRRPRVVHSWNFGGYLFMIHKFTAFGYAQPFYSLLCEFNPNKVQDDFYIIKTVVARLKSVFGDSFVWDDTRTDYTFDVPYSIQDVRLLSRKSASSYCGTYYFGKRGESGYTRVYNKRQEILDRDHKDIGEEWTRVEYQSISGYEVNYDPPFLLGDLGNHEVLRYVPMDAWPAALRTFHPATARKIKQDSLIALPFHPEQFGLLYSRLLERLELPSPYNVEFRSRGDQAAVLEDLELISAELRRFAKDID